MVVRFKKPTRFIVKKSGTIVAILDSAQEVQQVTKLKYNSGRLLEDIWDIQEIRTEITSKVQ